MACKTADWQDQASWIYRKHWHSTSGALSPSSSSGHANKYIRFYDKACFTKAMEKLEITNVSNCRNM